MKLRINLATRQYVDRKLLNAILAAAFVLLFLLLAFQVQRVAFLAGELKRVEGESSTAARSGKIEVVSESQYRDIKSRIGFANDVLERKSLNWLSLLDYLEEVVPQGVALNRLEPDPHDGTVKVGGAARSFANLRQFLENLQSSPHFSEVYLLGQNETKVGLTQQGILFNLSVKVTFR